MAKPINSAPFDRFTLVHLGAGYVAGRLGLGWVPALVVGIGWEVVEDALKEQIPEAFPHPTPDAKYNALFDAGAFLLGWNVGRPTVDDDEGDLTYRSM